MIAFERRGGTDLVGESLFFVEAEIFMHKAASCIHQKNSVDSLHRYKRLGQWKRCPCWLTSGICWRSFKKWPWGWLLWGGPGGRQLAAFPPANTSSPAQKPKIDGSDIFRSITAANQLPFQCLLPGILLNPILLELFAHYMCI